ncbi:MAG TPA: hypothetical protein VEI47_03495 [Gemmatimonadales bacterium]|nr:hypothetical protein [Gemmatimonadales bacterium]
MRRTLALTLASLALSGGATALSAQVTAQVDFGLGGTTAVRGSMASLVTIAPTLRYQTSRLRILADGDYLNSGGPATEATGSVDGGYFTQLGGPLLGEITGSLRARSGVVGISGAAADVGGRLHLVAGARGGAWLGLAAGRDPSGPTYRWEATAWRRIGRVALQLRGSQTAAVDPLGQTSRGADTLPVTPDTFPKPRQVRVITDVGAWLRWSGRALDLALAAGRRYSAAEVASTIAVPGSDLSQNAAPRSIRDDWWQIEGTWWLSARLGINTAVGRSPADLQFQTNGGRFFRVGLRAAFGGGGASRSSAQPGPPARTSGIRVTRSGDGVAQIELSVPERQGVERVELMGDVTDWRAIDMEPAGLGRWRLLLRVSPGMHFLNVRYDGGPWQPPPGTQVVADDFDRHSGVIVIE